MTDRLVHRPEGDHNPYDVPLWGRHPFRPTTTDRVRLGVRVTEGLRSVTLEVDDGELVSHQLARQGDTWWASIGPLEKEATYRFVADTGHATEWFDLEIERWNSDRFTSVHKTAAGAVLATEGGHSLVLATTEGALVWSFEPSPAPAGGGAEKTVDGLHVRITGGEATLSFAGRQLTLVGPRWQIASDGAPQAVSLRWRLAPEESLFGSGERYDALDQRGRTPDVRVFEEYKGQGSRTYFPVPWIMSDRGYGISIDTRDRVRFDLGSGSLDVGEATIPIRHEEATGSLYFGDPAELVRAYATHVGLATQLPIWAYGPWMSGNEWNSDIRIRTEVTRTLEEKIPATVIVIEAWSDETTFYLFNDTEYEPVDGATALPPTEMTHGGKWPDPKGLIGWLHERGVRVLLWQIPILKDFAGHPQHDADLEYVAQQNLSVQTTNGESYRNRGWWFPGGRAIDFTNPAARRWWFSKRAWLLDDLGIDGFKTDGGEHLWGEDVITSTGERGDVAANCYPVHYLGSYHAFLADHGHDRPLLFSRAGYSGAQAFPAHWAGDEDSTWDAYRASLTAGLTAGLSGIGYWSWDIAGFSGPIPSSELFQRGTAMGAFSPIMQYHSEHNDHQVPNVDRTPWNIAERTGDVAALETYRWFARVRMNLVPYLAMVGSETSATGMPMMRAMLLHYPDDQAAVGIDDQYLLGPDLLVAPVLKPSGARRRVYLPDGPWWGLWDAEEYKPGWHDVVAPLDRIPVFVRGGVAVPLWMGSDGRLGSFVDLPGEGSGELVHMIFPGTGTNITVHPVTGEVFRFECAEDGETIRISGTAGPGAELWLRGAGAGEVRTHVAGSFVSENQR